MFGRRVFPLFLIGHFSGITIMVIQHFVENYWLEVALVLIVMFIGFSIFSAFVYRWLKDGTLATQETQPHDHR